VEEAEGEEVAEEVEKVEGEAEEVEEVVPRMDFYL
tara:strand:- start:1749 stop:1853 length:105 start_codon:yes stop_codon:yes gene_type:complete